MRSIFVLAAILLLSSPPPANSQSPAVEPGDRVKLQLNREAGERRDEGQQLVGEVLSVTSDSLRLRIHPDASPVTVAIGSLERLERSRGVPSAAMSALRQGAQAGAVTAIWLPIFDLEDGEHSATFSSVGQAVLVGAIAGTAVGMIVGALRPGEDWRHLRLPHERAPLPDALRFPRVTMAGGRGLASGAGGAGDGAYARLGVRLARLSDRLQLRGEMMYLESTLEETPFSCERAETDYCLDRGEETRRVGAGITLIADAGRIGSLLHLYVPFGLGVVHSRVETEEIQGCIVAGQPASCAEGPSFERIRYSRDVTGTAVNVGLGMAVRLGVANLFVELRGQVMDEDAGEPAQFIPIAIGLSF